MKNIDDYIMTCTELLLDELEASKVIKVINKNEENKPKKYRVSDFDKPGTTITHTEANTIPGIIQDFYDFRNILSNVLRNIKVLSGEVGINPSLNKVVDKFIEHKVIDPPWKNVKIIREFFDKAEDILAAESTRKTAILTLKRNKVSFNPLIIKALEYFSNVNLQESFREGNVINPRMEGQRRIGHTPNFIINVPESKALLLVEVKFRKRKIGIKEVIDQATEVLRFYDDLQKQENKCLIIVYTYGQLGEIERDKFSFKEIIERRYSLNNRIFFVPVGINYLEHLNTDLKLVKDDLLHRQVSNFNFRNQTPPVNSPRIDDHFYDRIIDLTKVNLEIRVKAKLGGHWRFGVRFSKTENLPSRDERHPVLYPLIHLQKEANSDRISITYYDENKKVSEFPTRISEYKNEELVLKIYTNGDEKLLEILDNLRRPIIDNPISVGNQNYCWIFAWADGKNPFEFDAEIIENYRF